MIEKRCVARNRAGSGVDATRCTTRKNKGMKRARRGVDTRHWWWCLRTSRSKRGWDGGDASTHGDVYGLKFC
jgi:hypothetical protein